MYCKIKHPKSAHLHVHNKSHIYIHPTAQLSLSENGYLDFTVKNLENAPSRPCSLYMNDHSILTSDGFTMFEGADIYVGSYAKLELGKQSYMNASTIECGKYIRIGDKCAIASHVIIQDTDYHTTYDNNDQPKPMTQPIIINNHVWICEGVTILKGVTIGEGSIIAAKAVVTNNVPPHCLVAGNPAKIIKENVRWS